MLEREIKLKIGSIDDVLIRLRDLGAWLLQERCFEDNQLLDYNDLALKNSGKLIRVRRYGSTHTLTYKGPAEVENNVKSREEMEIEIPSADSMTWILQQLGLQIVFRYQKYRAIYGITDLGTKHQGEGSGDLLQIMVDETPLGNYLELEGEVDAIFGLADILGYPEDKFILKTYRELYVDDCQRQGLTTDNMIFPSVS